MGTWRVDRKYPRHPSGFLVLYRTAWEFDAIATGRSYLLAEAAGDYLEGRAGNISYRHAWMGGMFVATDIPLPTGAIVELSFLFNSDDPSTYMVRVQGAVGRAQNFHGSWNKRAIVRWHRYRDEPCGMGIEFVNFPFAARTDVEAWVRRLRVRH
jgi:hypothetical protein